MSVGPDQGSKPDQQTARSRDESSNNEVVTPPLLALLAQPGKGGTSL